MKPPRREYSVVIGPEGHYTVTFINGEHAYLIREAKMPTAEDAEREARAFIVRDKKQRAADAERARSIRQFTVPA